MLKKRILVTGGTGFIGSKLCLKLQEMGYNLTILSRKPLQKNHKNLQFIRNLNDIDFNFDIVINLAGEPISQRWSENKRNKIYTSRINLTQQISDKINSSKNPPKIFISGSAIGYYGTSETKTFDEQSSPTTQNYFSQKICFDWENAAKKSEQKTRLIILRTGVVIGQNGGIIKKMLPAFKFGLGGKIASGNQYFSWIHVEDAVNAIIHLMQNENSCGAFNITSPNHSNNYEFSQILAKNLHRPCFFKIPKFVLQLIYKNMATELLIEGQKVYPKALIDENFTFKYSNLDSAIKEALQIS